jgi:hypothetical protein
MAPGTGDGNRAYNSFDRWIKCFSDVFGVALIFCLFVFTAALTSAISRT